MRISSWRITPGFPLIRPIIWAATFCVASQAALGAEFQMNVHSIDEVAKSDMPTAQDITATEAVILFESSIPLACSVVYGETPEFGQIAVDDDMDGGAHSDHHPILAGLRPETDYYFRVQGTAADGRVFVGEVQKFTTLARSVKEQSDLATIAAGARVVNVSSNYGGAANDQAWGANFAIDGSSSKAWSSAGDGNDAFIEIELGQETEIGTISVWSRSMSDGTARIKEFELTFDDGTKLGPFRLPNATQAYEFPVDATARRMRLDVVDSTGGNVGLIELGIFQK